ncbi:MAG: DUF2784 domain-containing protein [Deltaproteobacteria bacterium]|nr:DUF2784 domain-containing protein [Deltaproteobacteria bacterium]
MYAFFDYSFTVFHSGVVLFVLVGWVWRKTRRIHLIISGLIMLSWFGLGICFGWGYCPCTEWHWTVKSELGERHPPYSYVKYYMDRLTGISWEPLIVDGGVVALGVSAFVLSCWFNLRDRKKTRARSKEAV